MMNNSSTAEKFKNLNQFETLNGFLQRLGFSVEYLSTNIVVEMTLPELETIGFWIHPFFNVFICADKRLRIQPK